LIVGSNGGNFTAGFSGRHEERVFESN
jgi:hypothetical protein